MSKKSAPTKNQRAEHDSYRTNTTALANLNVIQAYYKYTAALLHQAMGGVI